MAIYPLCPLRKGIIANYRVIGKLLHYISEASTAILRHIKYRCAFPLLFREKVLSLSVIKSSEFRSSAIHYATLYYGHPVYWILDARNIELVDAPVVITMTDVFTTMTKVHSLDKKTIKMMILLLLVPLLLILIVMMMGVMLILTIMMVVLVIMITVMLIMIAIRWW